MTISIPSPDVEKVRMRSFSNVFGKAKTKYSLKQVQGEKKIRFLPSQE
jgi:hypothetical protein